MEDRVYFAYIVASMSRTLYIGMTGDLRMRIYQHKQKLHPDGFAATYNCNRLVWFERFMDPANAIAREKQLKGWKRAKKTAHIEKNNPTWEDLSEGWYPKSELPEVQRRVAGFLRQAQGRLSTPAAAATFAQNDKLSKSCAAWGEKQKPVLRLR